MDSTRKQVSDIANNKFAKYVMQAMKDCNLVSEFKKYVESQAFKDFRRMYCRRTGNEKFNPKIWYDCEYCIDILGCCNFTAYLTCCEHKVISPDPYAMLAKFVKMFDYDEYMRYYNKFDADSRPTALRSEKFSDKEKEIVKKWELILK